MRGALVVWMCLAVVARAEGSTRFHLRAWGVAEGLPQTSVTDLCEDERGFLWVATFGGLARFDGSRFVRSDPPHGDLDGHRFVSVACDGARIWAGTDTGRLFHFDDFGRGAPEELTLAPGGLQDPLWDLEVTRDGLRIAAGRAGVWAVRGAAAQQLSTSVSRFVASTPRGETWATGELQLHCVEGPCGEATVPLREKAQSLRVAAGQLFVGSAAGLEELVDGRLVLRAPGVVMFVDDPVHARRWTLGAAGLQVSLGATTEHLSLAWGQAPLREPKVRRLLADGHGVLWVATDDQGLVAVRDRGVELLGEERGLTMRSVLLVVPRARGGALLGGYCQGLLELSASGDRFSPAPSFTANDCVFAAMEDERGTVWLDRGGALLRWDAAGLTTVWTLPAGENSRVIVPRGDSVWLATTAGLVELDVSKPTATMRRRWTKADGLLDDGVMMLTPVADGWLVGTQRGAMRLDAQGRLTRLIPAEQDRAAAVRDFFVEPSGVVWVATYGEGLARVAPGAPPTVTWLTREGGFCSDELSRVVPVGDALWFNSNQGAFRVRRASLEAHARGEGVAGCEPFVSGEGNGGGQLAGGLSNLGLLLPTVNGVARIDPSVPTPSRALPTFIDAAKVDETPLALQGVTRVPPGRRDLTISLASPHVTAGTLSIEQTLETEGRKLSRVGGRTAAWLNLDPGDYVFTARRRSVDGTFGPPVTLRFRLEPRVLETPWARWGLPLLALALVALGVRWWTRTARARAEALEAELEQRRQLEAAQRERDEVYRTVFAGSPVPLFLIGDDDVIEELNPAARDAFPGARPGSSGLELLPSGERASFREVLQRARAGERISGVEFGGREPTQRGDERAGVFPAAESLARAEVETDPDQSSIDASSSGDTRPHDREAARSEVVTDPSTDQSSVVGSRNAGASAASTTYRSGAAESAGSTSARDWAASEAAGAPEHGSAAAARLDDTSRSATELSSAAARSAPGQSALGSAAAALDDTSRSATELSSAAARSAAGQSEHISAAAARLDDTSRSATELSSAAAAPLEATSRSATALSSAAARSAPGQSALGSAAAALDDTSRSATELSSAAAPLDDTSRSATELSSAAARSSPGQSALGSAAAAPLEATSRSATALSSAAARSAPGQSENISAAAARLDDTSRSATELSSAAARSAAGQFEHGSAAAARLDDTSRSATELSSAAAAPLEATSRSATELSSAAAGSAGVSEHRSARSSPVDSSAASAEPAASLVETGERRFTPATSARNGASTHGFEQTSPERTPAEPARSDRPPTDAPTSRVLRIDAAPLVRGARRSVLVATTDLTALRAAEREKRALLARAANAQRLEGLGRLAAGIAHDFNNVLAALSLQIEDLRRAGGDAKLTAEMTDAVDMGRNLTRRFLIFGRGDAELTAIDLDDAVAHGQALLGRLFPRDVTFEVRLGAPGAMAWLPRSHLDQLLLNLVVNARDATSGGGRVLVQTRRTTETREEQLQVLPRPAGELVELIVEDSGVGMDEATLTRAFEPFFTTKSPSQGTGVGLTIVHGIALRAGAGLTVSSIRGGGTRFVVQLRAAPRAEPLREEFPKPAAPAQPANKPTVLICDDVAPLRSAVGRVFRRAGFVVLEASDGEEALTRLAAEPVSVLVTDLVMPRVDGVELIKRVRASGSQVPIILLSGFPGDALARLDPPHRHRLVALEKPFVPEVLVKTAKELLAS